jgi:hypothetical protein
MWDRHIARLWCRYGLRKPKVAGSHKTFMKPKFVVGCFGLDSVLLTEGSKMRHLSLQLTPHPTTVIYATVTNPILTNKLLAMPQAEFKVAIPMSKTSTLFYRHSYKCLLYVIKLRSNVHCKR